jgi:hypothetical protein
MRVQVLSRFRNGPLYHSPEFVRVPAYSYRPVAKSAMMIHSAYPALRCNLFRPVLFSLETLHFENQVDFGPVIPP